jgi:putative nucleotidyltransferase with HDIG domain
VSTHVQGFTVSSLAAAAERAGPLPELPSIVREALALLDGARAASDDVCELLLIDEELTERLRKVVRSRLFGVPNAAIPLREICALLGPAGLRQAILVAVVQTIHRERGPRMSELLVWEHALAVAVAAARLARGRSGVDEGSVFLAGLIHDVGKSVLDENRPGDYRQVLARVFDDTVSFVQAENDVLGFDHSDVGALVCRKWGMPAEVEEIVRLHHRPEEAEICSTGCAVVGVANALCCKLEIGPECRPGLDLPALDGARRLGIEPDELAAVHRKLRRVFETDSVAFGLDLP